mgnify:CR=1 FL=1
MEAKDLSYGLGEIQMFGRKETIIADHPIRAFHVRDAVKRGPPSGQ